MAMTVGAMVLSLVIKSAAFSAGQAIPKPFTCDGRDESPNLEIANLPAEAKSWAMITDDPDAPGGTFVHWVIWNLPARVLSLEPGVTRSAERPDGSRQGKNSFGKLGYSGPCPPPGLPHHYRFRVFALDGKLALPSGASAAELERAMRGHVIGKGTLVGTYGRR